MSDIHDKYSSDDPDVRAINEGQRDRSPSPSINQANESLDDIAMIMFVGIAIVVVALVAT